MKLYLDKIEETPLRRNHVKKYNTFTTEDIKNDLISGDTIFQYIAEGNCKGVESSLCGLDGSTLLQIKDRAGWSILHDSIILNHVEIAQYLINNPAMDVNLPCNSTSVGLHNWRPIHVACEFGKVSILKMLIIAKANTELYMEVVRSELIEPTIINNHHLSAKNSQNFNISDTYVILEYWNPLHLVVINDHFDCLEILIKTAKVFIESRSIIKRKTALILACELCRLETVKFLLESGANPNSRDCSNKTPLFFAAKRGHAAIVRILLEYGADPRIATKRYRITPLHISCLSRTTDSLSATVQLIEAAPDVVNWKCNCLLTINNSPMNCYDINCFLLIILVTAMCVDVHLDLQIRKLIYLLDERKVEIDSLCTINDISNNNALHLLLTIIKKHQSPLRNEFIDILLAHSINVNLVNSKNESIIFSAVQLNLLGLVNTLLQKGADPNIVGNHTTTPLMFSVQKRHNEMTKLLINYGANINEKVFLQNFVVSSFHFTNCTVLHAALIYTDLETFQFLIDKGANPFLTMDLSNETDVETNVSLLHLAILSKLKAVNYINLLLKIGLDIESKTSNGDTPFLFAIRHSNIEACRLLLTKGCDKNAVNCANESGLILSATEKNPDVMKFLLDNQVDVNKQDNCGFTALHHCFIKDFRAGIDYFLHNSTYNLITKININVSCYELKSTYLVHALQYGNENDVVRLLKQGADPNSVFLSNDETITPIFLAVKSNSFNNLCQLYKYGANLNYTSSPNQETVLHVALRNKNIFIARQLIFTDVNIQLKSRWGQGEQVLPIHVAVQNGLDKIIETLINFGSSINSTMILKSVERVSPLHLAALNDLTSTINFLTCQQSASININSTRSDSFNALLTLVSKKNVTGVQTILNSGADVNTKCVVSRSRNASCLHIAAQVGSAEIVRLLLEYGADPFARMITGDRDGILPIHLATESGHLEIVQLFLNWGVSVSAAEDCGLTCLHYAANAGCTDIMEMLLRAGADVNAEATDGNRSKMLPLHMASEKGHKKSIKLLLKYGSPINAVFSRVNRDNLTALYIATSENRENVMKYLMKSGADPDIQENNLGATALHITCQRGFTKAIVYLIGVANCSLNISLNTGISTLHLTAEKGHNELSFWLLRCKCNPNLKGQITDSFSKKTSFDISPLNQACGFGHLTVVKLLVKFGADIHCAEIFEGHRGIQPIHCAAIRGRFYVIPALLEAGVSIDATDENGLTPLHWSVIEGFYDCTKFLINLTANVNIVDKNGKKPKDYAVTANLMSLF